MKELTHLNSCVIQIFSYHLFTLAYFDVKKCLNFIVISQSFLYFYPIASIFGKIYLLQIFAIGKL
jgi:hypothetical protein